jgi:hypothetical protein
LHVGNAPIAAVPDTGALGSGSRRGKAPAGEDRGFCFPAGLPCRQRETHRWGDKTMP